ncbi:MAG: L,D-transpeptidase family protein [Niameybacter sp.]|uniref:L,D-transpeptidase family protein n=1 Tax=Niameybacter sp. TaxID=2033640 RepID=UPI002FC63E6F
MRPSKTLFLSALTLVLLTLALFIVRDLNFHWVKVGPEGATVTINFLFPMDKDAFQDTIKIQNQLGYTEEFTCSTNWLSSSVCQLKLKEAGSIRGQKVQLIIDHAPTQYGKMTKQAMIPIQFQSDIQLVSPVDEILIATTQSFQVEFNTPMNKDILHHFLSSDAEFIIEPVKYTEGGKTVIDYTRFNFTPKKPLENDHKYILTFKKGMPSQSNVMLKENQKIILKTDIKPEIDEVSPVIGSKWVGLYPRITVLSKTPMKSAYLELNNEMLVGDVKSEYHAEFYPQSLLLPDTRYDGIVQIEATSGERSDPMAIYFTTQPLSQDRYWAEVKLGKNQEMIVYKGTEDIKHIQCSGGSQKTPTIRGTFYVQSKGDKYFSEDAQEGGNYWIMLSEQIRIHGMTRDEYWHIKMDVLNRLGEGQTEGDIVMREEDALWLYETLPNDTMVVIHE